MHLATRPKAPKAKACIELIKQLEQRLVFAAAPIAVPTVATIQVSESSSHALVTAKLNRTAAQPVSVSLSTAEVPGSAAANLDLRPASAVVRQLHHPVLREWNLCP